MENTLLIQSGYSDFLENGTFHALQRADGYTLTHSSVCSESTIRLQKSSALRLAHHIFQSYGIEAVAHNDPIDLSLFDNGSIHGLLSGVVA